MIFALKVKRSQACLSDCPFMPKEMIDEGQRCSGVSSFSSYEQVGRELEKEAVGVDFKETAGTIGAMYKVVGDTEAIVLTMISTVYELRKEGLFRNDIYCSDLWAKIIICDYVRRQGRKPLTGEWVPLGLFPHTASLVKTFQGSAEKKIASGFNRDLHSLKQRCASLGGSEAEGRIKADYFARFDLLPHVPLYLYFWAADEEFDAECKLLFDKSANEHIDIEYLAYLVERFAGELVTV
jgi:hypothetical protein